MKILIKTTFITILSVFCLLNCAQTKPLLSDPVIENLNKSTNVFNSISEGSLKGEAANNALTRVIKSMNQNLALISQNNLRKYTQEERLLLAKYTREAVDRNRKSFEKLIRSGNLSPEMAKALSGTN